MDWLFLLRIHNEGTFQIHATEDIFAEVLSNIRKHNPRAPGHTITRRIELMRANVDEILQTFPSNLTFTGTDQHDYHIHAAAIQCRSDFILTINRHSDISTIKEPYELLHPDDFFMLISSSAPFGMLHPIIRQQLQYWSSKPQYLQLDEALYRADCPKFSQHVLQHIQYMVKKNLL